MMRFVPSLVIVGAICASTSMAGAQAIDWQKVDDAFGRKPAVVSGDAHRYGFPRTDLNVTLDGVGIKPALALGGWVAFKPMQGDAMVMGDLVLLETEINPVMAKMIENGIDITAVHNHLLRANPATFYMHIGGHGDPIKLATAIHGLATGIGFQPTGAGKAAITGDFVMVAGEVNPVIKTLRANGIEVTALHSHMLDEQPRLFFMHFWANDDAIKLAKGLREALDEMANIKNSL
jgi:hypothetical protein